MSARGPLHSLAASPTTIGAITTLIVTVAVFLAYNANQGLPFVPVYRVSVEVPNGARLVDNNEVRIGGTRVGVIERLVPVVEGGQGEGAGGDRELPEIVARLDLKLDSSAEPLPVDSVFRVRYRSSFGLKYLEIERGDSERMAPEGFVFDGTDDGRIASPREAGSARNAENGIFVEQVEFDEVNNTFDRATRESSRTNLRGFGTGLAGRGVSLNAAIGELDPLFVALRPVMRTLSAEDTRLRRFVSEIAEAARIVAPVAAQQANLFTAGAVAFAAISSEPAALRETISGGPPTLETGIETLPRQRPFLREFAELSRRLGPGVRELRVALPTLNSAIDVGTPVLERAPAANRDLRDLLAELEELVDQPSTKLALQRLESTFSEALPLARHVVPAQTVCNYWNYWFTYVPESFSDQDQVGFSSRQAVAGFPDGPTKLDLGPPVGPVEIPGAQRSSLQGYAGVPSQAIHGGEDPSQEGEFDPYELPMLNGQPYGPTGQPWLAEEGRPDCQAGQNGYVLGQLLTPGQSPDLSVNAASDLPGSRGVTDLFWTRDGRRLFVDTRVPGRQP